MVLALFTSSCSKATIPMESGDRLSDIEIKYTDLGDSIRIDFINTSKVETYFLFSSYFNPLYVKSKYLFRYDSKTETFDYSFLPLVNYLNTVHTDKRIITDEALFNEHQVVYEFEKIESGEQFSLTLYKGILCRKESLEEVILDFDTNEITWSNIQKKGRSDINSTDQVTLEFAFYSKIDTLLNKGEEYRNPESFKKKAKNYQIATLSLRCK
ncbi:hypothetical protein [uncultured Roseivirga sp.]|uniref:hypothetical protein n=1 Tax=uncultured Roseivirga sp. TaxID=543088 RepID=UPI0025974987|nr:hypothetical protein [uncultured Roseivirga sp.]|tara:strand:- start:31 stop:666 length:636 start_codon:yes stop_codon:yes gene_type:complete